MLSITQEQVAQFITVAEYPKASVCARRGFLTYQQWLEEVEAPRVERGGRRVGIFTYPSGQIALALMKS